MAKTALITGISGQDGSYLAEFLLSKGYEVHGIVRRVAIEHQKHRLERIQHLLDRKRMIIHGATLENFASICHVLNEVKPDEVYHLAAQSFVSYSFEDEHSTIQANIEGTHHLLSACQQVTPGTKFYFAASSEMFGKTKSFPQTEKTEFHPRSPYGISKVAGYNLTRYYREHEKYKMFAVNGVLFNHESPRRGSEFVTRKITLTGAMIKCGLANRLKLGNPNAKRDWGFAGDYVEAMWLMMQHDKPTDFVIATGEAHSVKEFAAEAFKILGLDEEKYIIWQNPEDMRPLEVDHLVGNARKACNLLGWYPRVDFKGLVKMMVESDLRVVTQTETFLLP